MKYGLTIYGPFVDNNAVRERMTNAIATLFPVEYKQIQTVWATMQNFPDFNAVEVTQRHGRDLVIHVYYSPPNLAEDVDCVFHAKITPEGMYE